MKSSEKRWWRYAQRRQHRHCFEKIEFWCRNRFHNCSSAACTKKGWIQSFRIVQQSRGSSHSREEIGMTNVMQRFLRQKLHEDKNKWLKTIKKQRVVGSKFKRKKIDLVCPLPYTVSKKKKRVGGKLRKVRTSVYITSSQTRPRSSPTGTYSMGVKRKKWKRTGM